MRNLVLVFGDQLDRGSAAFDGFDKEQDAVWMAEVSDESEYVWSHKARIVMFLAAMRHFRCQLEAEGIRVLYQVGAKSFEEEFRKQQANRVICVEPGEYRVREIVQRVFPNVDMRPDRHFYASYEDFEEHARGRKQLRMEYFYREMRKKHGVLMDEGRPAGGQWNFDAENRGSFGKQGPGLVPVPVSFAPDAITREVIEWVEARYTSHPGQLSRFDFPVTRAQALQSLEDFIANRLPGFGARQDAMWTGEPLLYHSRLSAAMNLKLLNPREVVLAAEEAYRNGRSPLESVEGFIRQILGWREFMRGMYWKFMPGFLDENALDGELDLPTLYWNAETDMNCLHQAVGQTLEYGYAHHIQRLMVTGLFALLLGVVPRKVHEWYLAVYIDAVEWVELPNTIGMSQFGDGGRLASKPYIATGKYIQRMSNYCQDCRYRPGESVGENACPFTTLYWDFLMRNAGLLAKVPRMELQLKNLARLSGAQKVAIRRQADQIRSGLSYS